MSAIEVKTSPLLIDGFSLSLEDLEPVADARRPVKLSDAALKQLTDSRATVEKILAGGKPVYGITTGFGKFKDVYIDPADSKVLQKNLILSHAAGVGANLDTRITRVIMLLRANALAKGFSGIRPSVVQLLLDCLNKGVHPLIPEKGSLGASGDLAPLAHLSLLLIGYGKAEYQGKIMDASEALAKAGLQPVELEAKEGLALTNGTQAMAAIGSLTLLQAERLAKMADIIGAMSLEAQLGSAKAFDERIHKARPIPGQLASAANLRRLLKDSGIVESHTDCAMVQDAYSLRCMPQVHGASRQAFAHVRSILEIEINSATDNPLVFGDDVLSGGNFHGQPLALPFDYMSIALAELANISERRTERLVNSALSNGLPAFLTEFGGLNSGFMIAHYTAAALVSENKPLAHPASVDSIPTSANQEDHVSMGTIGSRKARDILGNTTKVLAIELLCATQGLDFRLKNGADANHKIKDLSPGPGIDAAYKHVRSKITHLGEDREIHLDIDAAEKIVASGSLLQTVEAALGTLQ
ncbi:MAG: histidine ammonia-lyase [Candidatus Obscuribacterales bacterium]|nr:histidine ammonia-lyase [Candidatus Obscuribacterales bacterium]